MIEAIVLQCQEGEISDSGLLSSYVQKEEVLDIKHKKMQVYQVFNLPYNPRNGKPVLKSRPYNKARKPYVKKC